MRRLCWGLRYPGEGRSKLREGRLGGVSAVGSHRLRSRVPGDPGDRRCFEDEETGKGRTEPGGAM